MMSLFPTGRHMIFICQITDDNIDPLTKMMPARFLHYKFSFFFVINRYLCGNI